MISGQDVAVFVWVCIMVAAILLAGYQMTEGMWRKGEDE